MARDSTVHRIHDIKNNSHRSIASIYTNRCDYKEKHYFHLPNKSPSNQLEQAKLGLNSMISLLNCWELYSTNDA